MRSWLLGLFVTISINSPLAAQQGQDKSLLPITVEQRGKAISAIAEKFDERYVFPDVAAKVKAALEAEKDKGRYANITTGQELARVLTIHLQEMTKDKHVRVNCSTKKMADPRPTQTPDPTKELSMEEKYERMMASVRVHNAGYTKVERLPGNIGYIRLDGFMHPHANREPLQASMAFVKNTDALILDLRYNAGGPPWTVRDVCTYFFAGDKPVLLNTIKARRQDFTEEFWTWNDKEVPGPRYLGKPVFVLTSAYTFSGAEECAYDLQSQKRATVVGETTGGGANAGIDILVADHYMVNIPTGQAINPVTKTTWERTGVRPDVEVDADKALDTARELAVKSLMDSKDEKLRVRVMADIDGVSRRLRNVEERRLATIKERQSKKQ
ncbi:MAG: S41 family peptidase [Gemmatales bacterium]